MAHQFLRVDGLTAPEANIAVLLCRGPGRQTQLFIWDFNTDQVVAGDKVRAKCYSRRSDVSRDGKYLVTFLMGNPRNLPNLPLNLFSKRYEDTFTLLSTPPSFAPEALWVSRDTYGGGGFWHDNQTLILTPFLARTVMAPPGDVAVLLGWIDNPELSIFSQRMESRDWTKVQKPIEIPHPPREKKKVPTYEEALAIGERPYFVKRTTGSKFLSFQKSFAGGEITYHCSWDEQWCTVHDNQRVIGLELRTYNCHPLWIDVDNSGRLVYADKGRLFAWKNFPEGDPQLIADLNPT